METHQPVYEERGGVQVAPGHTIGLVGNNKLCTTVLLIPVQAVAPGHTIGLVGNTIAIFMELLAREVAPGHTIGLVGNGDTCDDSGRAVSIVAPGHTIGLVGNPQEYLQTGQYS